MSAAWTLCCLLALGTHGLVPAHGAHPTADRTQPAARDLDGLAILQAAIEPQVRHAYPGATTIRVTATPAALRLLPACGGGIAVDLQGQRLHGNLAVRVQCATNGRAAASSGPSARLPVTVDVQVPMLVATAPIPRGTRVLAGHVALRPLSLGATALGVGSDYLADPAEVLGLRTRNAIRAGQALAARHLEASDLVTAGEQVALAAGDAGFSVSVAGQALQNGRQGDQIRVRNLATGRVVAAWVTGRGRTHTRPPESAVGVPAGGGGTIPEE